ncbi:MAG: twin-arginine translocation signal domain-containing protein [Luteolibacter sp.]
MNPSALDRRTFLGVTGATVAAAGFPRSCAVKKPPHPSN